MGGLLLERLRKGGARLAAAGPTVLTWPTRYLIGVALTGLALLLRLAIAPQEAGLPYVTFFPAATLSAIVGGFGPGMAATALGSVLAAVFFIEPFGRFDFNPAALLSSAVFWADEVVVCLAIEMMRRYYGDYVMAAQALRAARAAEERARLAAERANEAKSTFLASASHDLRQPYQAMRLFHATLQTLNTDPALVPALAHMDVAMRAGEELLQSLLQVSTLEAGLTVPVPVEVNVADLLADVAISHRAVAEAKGLKFRLKVCHRVMRVDPVLLRRLVDNLVANAIRYTDRGGVLLACRQRGGRPCIEVWDTGIGIAPEHQEAVFEEFFQVGNRERDRSKGVGLGLAVVRRTAELLGLELRLRSMPGRGTLFAVSAPAGG